MQGFTFDYAAGLRAWVRSSYVTLLKPMAGRGPRSPARIASGRVLGVHATSGLGYARALH